MYTPVYTMNNYKKKMEKNLKCRGKFKIIKINEEQNTYIKLKKTLLNEQYYKHSEEHKKKEIHTHIMTHI